VSGSAGVSTVGISSTGYVGNVVADGGGTAANVSPLGVGATGFIGTVTESGSAIAYPAGVQGNGYVWAPVVEVQQQEQPSSTGGATGRVTTFAKPYKPARTTLRARAKTKQEEDEELALLAKQEVAQAMRAPIVKKITRLDPAVREEIRLQLIAEMEDEQDIEDLLNIIALTME